MKNTEHENEEVGSNGPAPSTKRPSVTCETVAAGAIIDIMTGGDFDWRSRIDQNDFLESSDWQIALAYARAALGTPSADDNYPVSYQQFKNGKWVECSEFVAKGWSGELSEGCRALYAAPPAPSAASSEGDDECPDCVGTGTEESHNAYHVDGGFQPCQTCKGSGLSGRAALSIAPVAGAKQWHHKKSGHVVTEIGRGRVQAARPIVEMQNVVIYEHDGNMWVRAVTEFEDGRFEPCADPRNNRGTP